MEISMRLLNFCSLVPPLLSLCAAACAGDTGSARDSSSTGTQSVAWVTVESAGPPPAGDLAVALLWEVESGDALIGSIVPAEMDGSEVSLAIDAIPPAEVQNAQGDGDEPGAYIAEARVALIDLDALPGDVQPGEELTLEHIGSAVVATPDLANHEYVLLWASEAFDSNGTPIAAGYQVWHTFATGNCPEDPMVVACLEDAVAGGANEAEAENECIQFELHMTSVPLEEHIFHIEASAEGPVVPPWSGNFPFCVEALCGATTCPH
jgi:hypothetical protein